MEKHGEGGEGRIGRSRQEAIEVQVKKIAFGIIVLVVEIRAVNRGIGWRYVLLVCLYICWEGIEKSSITLRLLC